MTKPRQRYTAEFKAQAVELISTGKPVYQIAEDLCIGSNLLCKWKMAEFEGRLFCEAFIGEEEGAISGQLSPAES